MEKKATFSVPFPKTGKAGRKPTEIKVSFGKEANLEDIPLSRRPSPVKVPDGCTLSIPITFERNSDNVMAVRVRTMEDDLLNDAATYDKAPSRRAIRMANAIILEELLTTGRFGSATQLAAKIGVSQPHLTTMLNLLNLPPEEIERRLFETCSRS